MLETITSKASPMAASQAAKTRRIIGIMLAKVKCELRIVRAARTKSDSIIPSRQSNADIRWDRYINRPIRDMLKAMRMFIWIKVIW